MQTNQKQIAAALCAAIGKQIQLTFADGVVQRLLIDAIDDEGFLHSGPDGCDPAFFWTRFEDVRTVSNL